MKFLNDDHQSTFRQPMKEMFDSFVNKIRATYVTQSSELVFVILSIGIEIRSLWKSSGLCYSYSTVHSVDKVVSWRNKKLYHNLVTEEKPLVIL